MLYTFPQLLDKVNGHIETLDYAHEPMGMTSAGASIFVDKMVKQGALVRREDPADRRNIIIDFTPRAEKITGRIDDRLNQYIFQFFADCTEEELANLEQASRLVCRVLDARDEEI